MRSRSLGCGTEWLPQGFHRRLASARSARGSKGCCGGGTRAPQDCCEHLLGCHVRAGRASALQTLAHLALRAKAPQLRTSAAKSRRHALQAEQAWRQLLPPNCRISGHTSSPASESCRSQSRCRQSSRISGTASRAGAEQTQTKTSMAVVVVGSANVDPVVNYDSPNQEKLYRSRFERCLGQGANRHRGRLLGLPSRASCVGRDDLIATRKNFERLGIDAKRLKRETPRRVLH